MVYRMLIIFCFSFLFLNLNGCDKPKKVDLTKKMEVYAPKDTSMEKPVRIAVGAMITPKEGFSYYRGFLDYIAEKTGYQVEFIDKESYAEINGLLKSGAIDCAFVCSGPYVDGKKEFGLTPLVAPQAYGKPVYYSYFIVPTNSTAESLNDLRGKTFAFTDPQSNTGSLVPTYVLARINETPDHFFKDYIYTYAHDKSIKAVAQMVVDGAAVDSLIWEYADKTNPEFTSKTKIIYKSPPYGIPPIVVRPGLDNKLRDSLKNAFLKAHEDKIGRKLLDGMMIEKFVEFDDSLYDSVRNMKNWITKQEKKG